MLNCLIRTGNHICMGLQDPNKQQEVSMNWREELRNMMMTRSLSLRVSLLKERGA